MDLGLGLGVPLGLVLRDCMKSVLISVWSVSIRVVVWLWSCQVASCWAVSCLRFYPCVSGLPLIGYSGIEWRSVPFTVSSYFLEFSFLLSP